MASKLDLQAGQDVLHFYSNSVVSAIEHLFPEIKLDPELFPTPIKRVHAHSHIHNFFVCFL